MTTFASAVRYTALVLAILMSGIAALSYAAIDETVTFASAGFVAIAIVCAIVGLVAQAICDRRERRIETESGLVY